MRSSEAAAASSSASREEAEWPVGRIGQEGEERRVAWSFRDPAVERRVARQSEVDALQRGAHVGAERGLGHAGLGEVQHVEEAVGVDLIDQVEQRDRDRRHVRHAQPGDRSHPIGMADRGVPHDRRAPVVADEDDRPVVERGGHRGDVTGELLQRVALDLRRNRAAAVATHVDRGDPIPVRREVLDLVVLRASRARANPARTAPSARRP